MICIARKGALCSNSPDSVEVLEAGWVRRLVAQLQANIQKSMRDDMTLNGRSSTAKRSARETIE